jgi:hypothetical protein
MTLDNADTHFAQEWHTVVEPGDQGDPLYWIKLITVTWQSNVVGIIETGEQLVKAKAALPPGEFGEMIKRYLPFTSRAAQKLMKLSRNPVLSDAAHVPHLPAHWGTLVALDTLALSPAELTAKIHDGTITPKMERKDVAKLKPKPADAIPRETPMAKLKRENAEQVREIAHLNERLAASDTALIQVDLIKDSAPAILDVFERNLAEGKMTANKIETLARGLLALLKVKSKKQTVK